MSGPGYAVRSMTILLARLPRRALAVNPRRGLAIAAAALLAVTAPAASAAAGTTCVAPEQTLFACSTGPRRVAVCASPDLSATEGVVQYRFGPPQAAELAYPPLGADWRALTRAGVLMFSGGGGSYLAFARPPYRYVVYTAIGSGWGAKAGVVVEQDGRRIASLACEASTVSSRLGPELFDAAGIAREAGDFDVP